MSDRAWLVVIGALTLVGAVVGGIASSKVAWAFTGAILGYFVGGLSWLVVMLWRRP